MTSYAPGTGSSTPMSLAVKVVMIWVGSGTQAASLNRRSCVFGRLGMPLSRRSTSSSMLRLSFQYSLMATDMLMKLPRDRSVRMTGTFAPLP